MEAFDAHWSSQAVPAMAQARDLRAFIDDMQLSFDLEASCRGGFDAEIWKLLGGCFRFFEVHSGPAEAMPKALGKVDHDRAVLCVSWLRRGTLQMCQGSHQISLREGSVVLWSNVQPIDYCCEEPIDHLTLMLPYEAASAALPGINQLVGSSIDASDDLGSLLVAHVLGIQSRIKGIPRDHHNALLRATIELLAATFHPDAANANSSSSRLALMQRAQNHIAVNLCNPELTASSIADALMISQSYLHRLFKDMGISVGDHIRKRRLDAARAALKRNISQRMSITEIAMHFGFCDSSHFSRTFKEEFGLSPSDDRKRHNTSLEPIRGPATSGASRPDR
jgi:AraC-like DNA-binding protein